MLPRQADVRARRASAVVVLVVCSTALVRAEALAETCAERTHAFHTALGLTPLASETRLLDVDDIEIVQMAPMLRCMRVDVVTRAALDLALELYDDRGALVARDDTPSSSPSVAVCSGPGRRYLALRVVAGRGRVDIVASEGRTLGEAAVAPCAFGAPGLASGRVDVTVSSPRAEDVLEAARTREAFVARGEATLVATAGSAARMRFDVGPGCHTVLIAAELAPGARAVASFEGVNGLDTVSLAPSVGESIVACTSERGLDIEVRSGAPARIAAIVVDLASSRGDAPSGLDGHVASRFVIEAARARARGMVRAGLAVAALGAGALEVEVPVAPGECALVLAASMDGGLAVGLVGDTGRLFADDTSNARVVHAWHCSNDEDEEGMHAWIRSFSERRRRIVYAIFSSRSR